MLNRYQASALFAVLSMVVTSMAGATQLVVNGGFENPVVPTGSPYLIYANPTGWTGFGDIVAQGYAGAVNSGDGNQWLDLNPGFDAGTGIQQSISLIAGTTYDFSFEYNGGGGGTTTQISYSLGNLLSGSVSTAAMNVYGGTPWQTFATTFTPTMSGAETLSFLPNGAWSGGFIDAVSITSSVPEPMPMALLGVGLMATCVARRKRV